MFWLFHTQAFLVIPRNYTSLVLVFLGVEFRTLFLMNSVEIPQRLPRKEVFWHCGCAKCTKPESRLMNLFLFSVHEFSPHYSGTFSRLSALL